MRRVLPALLAALALAAPASAATPSDDSYAPAPSPVLTDVGGLPVVQLDDGGGGLPYLGSNTAYNAGDWENTLRAFHDNGTYDREIGEIDTIADRYVLRAVQRNRKARRHHHKRARLALVLDIDETSLSNYSAIAADNFTFGTNSQQEAVTEIGTAIKPTLKLFDDARAAGVRVFFITGRPEAVRAHTESNLRREGYDGWKQLYLKPAGSTLTTVQYKTGARKDIESQGYTIVANVGDQFSDLAGRHARRGFKLPNPFYFLP